ncbi:MAG: GSCFA domain-containing protein [Prevotella sp.]|uniref:GSCFA domain-containing protein n=1 Tax=Prevotella sp. TaxID=59823 RepID=UPI001CB0D69E|nr:GSCFA domain-containing protein [Prevotella sp.]MBF1600873.1 GSCFA domain-containing protein [Prevotella sp.]MBF1609710.1 GSCFA domain-containing protein [Prevotella sp.]MBF1621488.1 GSCFA domain-containing protein [Prevotella sp.]MBF1624753.1 GSCFA domain-containing protein [Prevotella sp.]
MEFRTIVNIPRPTFELEPCERILFVGSCFADNIGKRFEEEKFRAMVNPFGVMYNPVSVLHTVKKVANHTFDTAVFTLGTNHVYVERATGKIVDNCQKRPQREFEERELTVEECADVLHEAITLLRQANPKVNVIITVSPIRYAKYGYHGSQLSKAVLLLAADKVIKKEGERVYYFPAYEIVNDELRDYRFYKADMLHPNEQAVEYIWEQLVATCFSAEAKQFLEEWRPIKEALAHRPFHPEAVAYQDFIKKTKEKAKMLELKYPNIELNL